MEKEIPSIRVQTAQDKNSNNQISNNSNFLSETYFHKKSTNQKFFTSEKKKVKVFSDKKSNFRKIQSFETPTNRKKLRSLSLESSFKILNEVSNLASNSKFSSICLTQNEKNHYKWVNIHSKRPNLLRKVKKYIAEHIEDVI